MGMGIRNGKSGKSVSSRHAKQPTVPTDNQGRAKPQTPPPALSPTTATNPAAPGASGVKARRNQPRATKAKTVVEQVSTGKPADETAGYVSVGFKTLEPNAKRVSLCGEFNGWSPEATPMTRADDGHWQVTVRMLPGRHHYKFFVDDQWLPDLTAAEQVLNEFGTLNSVITVAA